MRKADHYLKWREPTEDSPGAWVCVCDEEFGNAITLGWKHLGIR